MKQEKSDNTHSILKNTSIVFLFSVAAKVLSLIRESTIAAYTGVTEQADAYYMVQSIYAVFELGLSTAVYQSFFPLYKQLSQDPALMTRKERFANTAITALGVTAITFSAVAILGRTYIVKILAPGFSDYTKSLSSTLLSFSAPMLVFIILAECISTILRAHDQFAKSQFRELATHIAAITMIVILYPKIGFFALGLSMLAGAIARLTFQLPALKKTFRYQPCLDLKNQDIKEMFRRIPASLITAGTNQLKGIADKMIASLLPAGSVSALNYGHKLEAALGGLISTAIATSLYPEIVALQTQGEKQKLRRLIDKSISIFAFFAIPLCIGSLFFRQEIVTVVYGRGAFGQAEVTKTANVFAAYMLGVFFFGGSSILSNVFYGAGDTQTPMKINAIDLGLNVVLNLVFYQTMGAAGLALATSVSGIIAFLLRRKEVCKYIEKTDTSQTREYLKIMIATMAAGLISRAVIAYLQIGTAVARLIIAVSMMGMLYIAITRSLKSYNINFILSIIKQKFSKKK